MRVSNVKHLSSNVWLVPFSTFCQSRTRLQRHAQHCGQASIDVRVMTLLPFLSRATGAQVIVAELFVLLDCFFDE